MTQSAERENVHQILEETGGTLEAAQPPTRVLLAVHVKEGPEGNGLPTFMPGDGIEQDENALQVEAAYKSSSDTTSFLVSVPLAVWHLLPDHAGCQFLSLITGGNLRGDDSNAAAEPQSTEDDAISNLKPREEAIRASIRGDSERLNEPQPPPPPPPPPPYSKCDVLTMD